MKIIFQTKSTIYIPVPVVVLAMVVALFVSDATSPPPNKFRKNGGNLPPLKNPGADLSDPENGDKKFLPPPKPNGDLAPTKSPRIFLQ